LGIDLRGQVPQRRQRHELVPPRLVDDIDDRRVRLAALREIHAPRLGGGEARYGVGVLVERTQSAAGHLRVERRRLGRPGVDDDLDRGNVEAFEIEAAIDEHVERVAAKGSDDRFALGSRRIAAREGGFDAGAP
jgi:hypothetical protein